MILRRRCVARGYARVVELLISALDLEGPLSWSTPTLVGDEDGASSSTMLPVPFTNGPALPLAAAPLTPTLLSTCLLL